LVADDETMLVYARAPSASVACAVTLGILNSRVITLPVPIPNLSARWDDCDFANELYQAQPPRGSPWHFVKFPPSLMREDLLRNRGLALKRAYHLHCLEVYCRNHLAHMTEYMPDNVAAYLREELCGCDLSSGRFAKSIEEYAEISGIDPAAACQELRLKLDSLALVGLRTYAQHQKFMLKMNGCETDAEFTGVFAEFLESMYYKAIA
jgi:hypothetical protein